MSISGIPAAGPCGPAQLELDARCAEAERLEQSSATHQQRLRDAHLELQQITAQREADARLRDRRQLNEAKEAARVAYRQEVVTATSRSAVREAARTWLHDIDRLNRQLETTDKRTEELNRRSAELTQAVPAIEMAADAARVAAGAAQQACVAARRALAVCQEAAAGGTAPVASPSVAQRLVEGRRAIAVIVRGDRDTLMRLCRWLAEETGVEAGRLQLLLLELREAIQARALESHSLELSLDHPLWSQLPAESRLKVVAALAAMGFRFDGSAGWLDERVPTARELALAISHTGEDPRALRRPPNQQQINDLWIGSRVLVEEYLAVCAPSLELEQVMACLGPRAAGLSELWDVWGRLRPTLLAGSSA